MRTTGAVRKIDDVGKVVIPIEMMKSLGINYGDSIEFLLFKEDYIILRKDKPYINVFEGIKLTEGKIMETNAYNHDKIDETIKILNNIKKLYKKYLEID